MEILAGKNSAPPCAPPPPENSGNYKGFPHLKKKKSS